jgi:hypothetical protein
MKKRTRKRTTRKKLIELLILARDLIENVSYCEHQGARMFFTDQRNKNLIYQCHCEVRIHSAKEAEESDRVDQWIKCVRYVK